MTFGEAEEEILAFDETVGLGQAGLRASGGIRSLRVDSKTRAKMSKGTANLVNRLNANAVQRAAQPQVSGLASSLSFTPVQGIELVDPNRLARKQREEEDRWFSSGTFTQVNSKKSDGLALGPGGPGQTNSAQTSMAALQLAPLKRKITDMPPPNPKKQKNQ
jgi:U4/U6 small nuclear ribonucleoprotein PRP31